MAGSSEVMVRVNDYESPPLPLSFPRFGNDVTGCLVRLKQFGGISV